jgi:hypothetical protein
MRAGIRDAEGHIQRVDRSSDGGFLPHCLGLSKRVCGCNAQCLCKLDQIPISSTMSPPSEWMVCPAAIAPPIYKETST